METVGGNRRFKNSPSFFTYMHKTLQPSFINTLLGNVSLVLVVINVLAFLAQMLLGDWFTEAFMLISAQVPQEPWRLVTAMFLHGSPMHLLFNMYALFLFGPLIEQKIGAKRFLFMYFVTGIFASFISLFFYDRALGASGAIMGLLGVVIMLLPNLRILFFFVVPMSMRTAGIIFALFDIVGIFYQPGVANIAHLAGLSAGLAYGWYLLKKKKAFTQRFTNPHMYTESRSHVFSKKHTKQHKAKTAYNSEVVELSEEEANDYLKHGRL